MIRIHIPGFAKNQSGGPRFGDGTIMEILEDTYTAVLVIDGYCGVGTTKLIAYLKSRGIKDPYLFISHAHYDHYKGIREIIRDGYFKPRKLYLYNPDSLNASYSKAVRDEIKAMKAIIAEAKERGIPVVYLSNKQTLRFGKIRMVTYRSQPSDADCTDSLINDGSLCFWFPELRYLTTGDAGMWCVQRYNLSPIFVKGGHHGNDMSGDDKKPSQMCVWMYKRGCLYYWDNDISGNYTQFLMTGREDAINAGMKYFSCIGDLNAVFQGGTASIFKDGAAYRYSCTYTDKTNALKGANATVTRLVMRGRYDNSNTRMTALITEGYDPVKVQDKVNKVIATAKGIKSGSLNYGKNEARIAKIDSLLGKGYGQLVQDYINVLYGIKKEV